MPMKKSLKSKYGLLCIDASKEQAKCVNFVKHQF